MPPPESARFVLPSIADRLELSSVTMRKRILEQRGDESFGARSSQAQARAEAILSRVRVRRARPADKAVVLHFCRRTWGNYGDFIHLVWDEWVADERGYFAVAALGKRPIGTAKLTVLRPGEVWFEGLRVDREFRGIGLAQALTDFLLKKAARMRPKSIRYATGGTNLASQHIGGSWGFELLGRYTIMESTPDGRRKPVPVLMTDAARLLHLIGEATEKRKAEGPTATGRPGRPSRSGRTRPTDAARLTDVLLSSRFVTAMGGLASEGWTFHQIDEGFVRRALGNREIYAVMTDAGEAAGVSKTGRGGGDGRPRRGGRSPAAQDPVVAGLLVAATQRRRGRVLVWTAADLCEGGLPLLLNAARRLAHDRGLREVRLVMPYARVFTTPARRAGFHQEYHGMSAVVMQLAKRRPGRKKGG